MLKTSITAGFVVVSCVWLWTAKQNWTYDFYAPKQIKGAAESQAYEAQLPWGGSKKLYALLSKAELNSEIQAAVNTEELAADFSIQNPLDSRVWYWSSLFNQEGSSKLSQQLLERASSLSKSSLLIQQKLFTEQLVLGQTNQAVATAVELGSVHPGLFKRYLFYLAPVLDSKQIVNDYIKPVRQLSQNQPRYLDTNEFSLEQEALHTALNMGNAPLAQLIWNEFKTELHNPSQTSVDYLDFLAKQQSSKDFLAVWQQLSPDAPLVSQLADPNLAKQPNAESVCWNVIPHEAVKVGPSRNESGLALALNGQENLLYYHVSCLAAVEPNTTYQLQFKWQGDEVTTRSGVFVDVMTPGLEGSKVLGRSSVKFGDWLWQPETVNFNTPADVQVIKIRIRRNKTSNLDSKISGRVAFENFELKAL